MNYLEENKTSNSFLEKAISFIDRNKHIIVPVFILVLFLFLQSQMVFADDGSEFAKTTLKTTLETLIKIMFIGTGVLSLVFGAFELGVTALGQNPDAKNKAVMGFGIGIVLIALGIAFLSQIDGMVSFFIS